MKKLIQHNIPEERHELTKQLRLDLYELKHAKSPMMAEFFEGRLFGTAAAYNQLGIIDSVARQKYIMIIANAACKRLEEIANEI